MTYHCWFESAREGGWARAICREFDVEAEGASRECAMVNLAEAVEQYLDLQPGDVTIEPNVRAATARE